MESNVGYFDARVMPGGGLAGGGLGFSFKKFLKRNKNTFAMGAGIAASIYGGPAAGAAASMAVSQITGANKAPKNPKQMAQVMQKLQVQPGTLNAQALVRAFGWPVPGGAAARAVPQAWRWSPPVPAPASAKTGFSLGTNGTILIGAGVLALALFAGRR